MCNMRHARGHKTFLDYKKYRHQMKYRLYNIPTNYIEKFLYTLAMGSGQRRSALVHVT